MAEDCVKARFSIKMAHKTKRVFHNILRFSSMTRKSHLRLSTVSSNFSTWTHVYKFIDSLVSYNYIDANI